MTDETSSESAAGEAAVRRIVEGWHTLDPAGWADVVTDDIEYQNMPWPGVVTIGPDSIHQVLGAFVDRYELSFEVRSLITDGKIAYSERVEHFEPRPGTDDEPFDLAVTGVFELRGGKVAAWRDYFDRRAFKA